MTEGSGAKSGPRPFTDKARALGIDVNDPDTLARIREGRWTDPNAGRTTVGEWIDRWLRMQDMGVSTASNREYLIRRFLRPAWGSVMLSAMTTEAITRWENGLPARAGVSRRTAGDARSNPKASSLDGG